MLQPHLAVRTLKLENGVDCMVKTELPWFFRSDFEFDFSANGDMFGWQNGEHSQQMGWG
jgi:hypothetical protein